MTAAPFPARSRFTASPLPIPAHIAACGEQLARLDSWLAAVALIGSVTSGSRSDPVLADVDSTQRRFHELRTRLVQALMERYLSEIEVRLGSLAQVAVNTLVRNLFERSADIGFLATDDAVRAFLAAPGGGDGEALRERLRRYVAKYSVYDDVILLDSSGEVRCRLDAGRQAGRDEWLMAELANLDGYYLECYRPSPLLPGWRSAHLFVAPVHAAGPGSQPLGYLCLCFGLSAEMASLFAEVGDEHHLLALIGPDGRVAESSLAVLPPGSAVGEIGSGGVERLLLGGVNYCCRTLPGVAYQSYAGLGWRCMALSPQRDAQSSDAGAADVADDQQSIVVGGELQAIQQEAGSVSRRLRLAVLNGRVAAAQRSDAAMAPILLQIDMIVGQVQQVFDMSVALFRRSNWLIAAADAAMRAFSIVNIMDRNLYERANDVRWWALDEHIRTLMSPAAAGNTEAGKEIAAILAGINALYTVYTDILVFDCSGAVLARSAQSDGMSQQVPAALTALVATLERADDQAYRVSPFGPTPLYGGAPTWLYLAAVRTRKGGEMLGGMATVFDAGSQFAAIIDDHLPAERESLGIIVDSQGVVIAAVGAGLSPGDRLDAELAIPLELRDGERDCRLMTWRGRQWMVASVASSGYREYKRTDGYRNDLLAVVGLAL